ncbi:MAG: trypsin-like peptidase domain-containing protein [Patescibacteria group bacterium]|nr:trypsin-like peptidase domain-containing protein [Patescibacteria group bacterium]
MNTLFKLVVVAAFLVTLGVGMFNLNEVASLSRQISLLESRYQSLSQSQASTTRSVAATANALAHEVANSGKTQDQLLTTAVAKSAPAVVSVVISKDVPNLQVQYVNPFGDNPLFKDFNFQIPVYQQKGSYMQQIGAGSGFLISHNGYILTNRHVVSDTSADYTVLLSNGSQKTATVVYRDPNNDVAVIKIDGTYPTIASLGDSSAVKLGQTVVAIGNALGEYNNSVSVGIISGLDRTISASDPQGNSETLNGVFQTDASINLGNSGGPLIDLSGDVIGMNVATVSGSSNISFSIPINSIKGAISAYI